MLSKNQIREIQSLQLKKTRSVKRRFIAEGVKTVLEILEQRPELLESVYATRDFINTHNTAFAKRSVVLTEVSEDELKKISLQSAPNQVLAQCRFLPEAELKKHNGKGFSFYLDDVRDPGNFGTIIRISAWFGMNTLYCSPSTCELYNPKVIQSTMGAFMRVNVVYIELTDLMQNAGFKEVYGAVLEGENLYSAKLQSGLLVIGNEANGISNANLSLLSKKITIPAAPGSGTESLNASMAAGIIAAEVFRQGL